MNRQRGSVQATSHDTRLIAHLRGHDPIRAAVPKLLDSLADLNLTIALGIAFSQIDHIDTALERGFDHLLDALAGDGSAVSQP